MAGCRHNTEGLILASTKEESEARSELQNTSYDTLIELVKAGKALFRFQDFWFGNGIFSLVHLKKSNQNQADAKIKNANLMEKLFTQNMVMQEFHLGFKQEMNIIEAFKKQQRLCLIYSSQFMRQHM